MMPPSNTAEDPGTSVMAAPRPPAVQDSAVAIRSRAEMRAATTRSANVASPRP